MYSLWYVVSAALNSFLTFICLRKNSRVQSVWNHNFAIMDFKITVDFLFLGYGDNLQSLNIKSLYLKIKNY